MWHFTGTAAGKLVALYWSVRFLLPTETWILIDIAVVVAGNGAAHAILVDAADEVDQDLVLGKVGQEDGHFNVTAKLLYITKLQPQIQAGGGDGGLCESRCSKEQRY